MTTVAQTSISSQEGKPIYISQINFDWDNNRAQYLSQNLQKGTSSQKSIKLTPKIISDASNYYKVNMKPSMGFISSFLPDMSFYFNAAPPYNFIRYVGPNQGPTSPVIIQEVAYN